MRKIGVQLTERAIHLYHELAHSIDQGPLALHVVWDVTATERTGVWKVGLTPESHFQAADEQLLNRIVVGRINGILVILDGPTEKPASKLSIRIDTTARADNFITLID